MNWRNILLAASLILCSLLSQAQRSPYPNLVYPSKVYIPTTKESYTIIAVTSDSSLLNNGLCPAGPNQMCAAVTSCALKMIAYDKYYDIDYLQVVIMHEIMHALDSCRDRDLTEHQFIYMFSKPLVETLNDKRNKNLKKWLFNVN